MTRFIRAGAMRSIQTWMRLTEDWHAWLPRAPIAPTPRRQYLYVTPRAAWHRTAATVAPWS